MMEVERLRAENAAMRPLVVAITECAEVAKWWNPERLWVCPFCQAYVSSANEEITHKPDCSVTQALALKERLGL